MSVAPPMEGGMSGTTGPPPTFWSSIRDQPPPVPSQLMRKLACTDACSIGKVKVLLRVSEESPHGPPYAPPVLRVDPKKKMVTLFDPGSISSTPQEHSRVGIAAPKMFAFDGIFTQEDSQSEVCSAALSDVIIAVLRGADGAVFTFGQPNLGQIYTMLGRADSPHSLGVIPSALWWLYTCLEERRATAGSRFSVRISALQVTSGDIITDLLTQFASGDQPHGVFLMEREPGNASILPKACEIRAPNVEKAAQLLDAALSNRHVDAQHRIAHFIFTINVYQYSVDTSAKGGVAGGRSRLHFMDFGPLDRGTASTKLSVSGLGNVLLAIFNGQKHLPYKDSRLPRLVRECIGSVRCVASLLVHVSAAPVNFQETLSTIQLASRVHRLRRRRMKTHIGGSGSGGSSEESRSGRSSRGTITDTGSSSVDPSSSEQSCDTVIYVGPGTDDATDEEHPPVYLPSINSGDNRCSMKRALRGSAVDSKSQDVQRTPKKSPKNIPSPRKDLSPHLRTKELVNRIREPAAGSVVNDQSVSGNKAINCDSNVITVRTPSKQLPSMKLCSPKSVKSPLIHRHKSHKTADASGIEVSEEQWIDGPRIPKAKKFDGHKIKGCELETWIDGPEATYGYMDDHKKSMIQKWVETQNVHVPNNTTPSKSPRQTHYKELTQFKTVADEETSPKQKHKEKKRNVLENKKDKDSPLRRKSFSEEKQPHLNNDHISRPKSQITAINSTPSRSVYYFMDNTFGSSPINATSTIEQQSFINNKLKRSNSPSQSKEETLSKQSAINNSEKRPLRSESPRDDQPDGEKTISRSQNKHLNEEHSAAPVEVAAEEVKQIKTREEEISDIQLVEEDEEFLQIICIEKEGVVVDTQIQTANSSECLLDGEVATPAVVFSEDHLENRFDQISMCSEESRAEVILEDDHLKNGRSRIFLNEVPFDLDALDEEAEEALNMSLDRWLADEEREFIEVTEPEEPAEMVDSWAQVTEEDLELTMAAAGFTIESFLPRRHTLPTLTEDPAECLAEERQDSIKIVHNYEQCCSGSQVAIGTAIERKTPFESFDIRGSSRYEQMINDPTFTAKTHYFAKRLEELRQLHEVYKNLAKQAPRGRCSFNSASIVLPNAQPNEIIAFETCNIPSGNICEADATHANNMFYNSQNSSSNFGQDFDFNWKSLLPEELDLHSDFGDIKNEDEAASEFSKDGLDPMYDIQSDIMPYLPSNYVNLTNLSTNTTPLISSLETNSNIEYNPIPVVEQVLDSNVNMLAVKPTTVPLKENEDELIQINATSFSDDENNVKKVKVKKEKRKKKLGILTKSKNVTNKESLENGPPTALSKLSWCRFFGSPKQKQNIKDSPKKLKTNLNIANKVALMGKLSDKSDKKYGKEKDRLKDPKTSKEEKQKESKINCTDHESNKSNEKRHQKLDNDRHANSPKSSKSPSRRSLENRSVSNNSKNQRKNELPIAFQQLQQAPVLILPQSSEVNQKSLTGCYQNRNWERDVLQQVSTSSVHGYDSGTDSGVGLKVTPRGKRIREENRHGESSGYDSVVRDSECSSFGSSQDSGLDEEGQKGKLDSKAKLPVPIFMNHSESNSSTTIKEEENQMEITNGEEGSKFCLEEVSEFDEEDFARYENHTRDEDIVKCRRTQEKIRALREKQVELKKELEAAKGRLTIDKSRWSFELHVEECMTFRDEGFLEALAQETLILTKRVLAARSHVLLSTSFTISPEDSLLRNLKANGSCGVFEERIGSL